MCNAGIGGDHAHEVKVEIVDMSMQRSEWLGCESYIEEEELNSSVICPSSPVIVVAKELTSLDMPDARSPYGTAESSSL
jgi:hypothetical protein